MKCLVLFVSIWSLELAAFDIEKPSMKSFCGGNSACQQNWKSANKAAEDKKKAAEKKQKEAESGSQAKSGDSNNSTSKTDTSQQSGSEFQDVRGLAGNEKSETKASENKTDGDSAEQGNTKGAAGGKAKAPEKEEEEKGLPF